MRRNKLLLQHSIQKLKRELYTSGIGLDVFVIEGNGKPFESDTIFQIFLPSELRMSTKRSQTNLLL